MSGASNPNYVKFGTTEILVRFATDRGELKTNGNGDYFFRGFDDGRHFACVSVDLERRLVDLGYRAGELVGIAKQIRNRATIWVVRMVEVAAADPTAAPPSAGPIAAPPVRDTRTAPQARGTSTRPAPIPEAKYAPPASSWGENDNSQAPPKPPARAIENRPAETPQAAGIAHVSGILRACLCAAIDAARDAQVYANQNGFPLTFSADQVQDLASTLYIQESKQANIRLMNGRDEQRRSAYGGR